ncbi:DUF2254 domain-containing protein [Altererythrobacter sp. BO-6]|uniref:DUF2254 domain-containing protein n=1 Tax=Altererythrobacter sp. BO-6 TaxID=2604537 RepID=UPI0013E165CC|nr:DUF2254 domain-containing protein [Altererythrobacter sp. BO-6]QIG52961.1 DUF2254 domain-containing protein [Altererythrobacter sp. BO-6]
MLARLHSFWFALKASYWFYPALFAALAFALALSLMGLDRAGSTEWLNRISWYFPAHPQGASNMLTVLAGSMIGVASTIFSITIAAVAYASGNYGPRLLTNFMEDKGNQLSLATFIGTFVYAITVLRAVRAEGETATASQAFVPQFALLASFGLMIVAVGVIIFFLHHIPASIRINTVLEGIGRGLLSKIAERFPDSNSVSTEMRSTPSGSSVTADATGYIRYIEFEELARVVRDSNLRIALAVRTGDFVYAGRILAQSDSDVLSDDIVDSIRGCFSLGGSRTPEQDLEFSIDELVEIALRALSPGINDPFTAINAIHWLGAATAELGQRELRQEICDDDGTSGRVIPVLDDFGHFVNRGFGAVRMALASSKIAALVALDSIRDAANQINDPGRIALLAREGGLLMNQAEVTLGGPDLQEVRMRHAAFQKSFAP